jgi:pyruvate dehydrogenase E1 component alpha subunit
MVAATPEGSLSGICAVSDDDIELLLLIRNFELALLDLFSAGKLNGTTHTCLGQEYIPVALMPLIADDFILSNHRGHGHYLARFPDPAGLLAEIMGREGAVCGGVGGSQHIYREGFLSTGVQGQHMPVAVGVGMHFKRTGQARSAVVFTGDGTWGEGAVYEALNMARLWRVPLLVIVEHNKIAQSTPTELQMAGTIRDRARAFGALFHEVDSIDINEIRSAFCTWAGTARAESTPLVVQFNTVRVGPHSKGDDSRSSAELASVRARDWYASYARLLGDRFTAIDAQQQVRVAQLVREIEGRPLAA